MDCSYFYTAFLSVVLIMSCRSNSVSVYPSSVRVMEGGSVRLKLMSTSTQETNFCNIESPSKKIYMSNNTGSHNEATDIFKWVDLKKCEIIITSITKNSNGLWKFSGETDDTRFSLQTALSVISLPFNRTRISTSLGSLLSLDCASSSNSYPTSCQIFNPVNELISEECTWTVKTVKPEDDGAWTCRMTIMGAMNEINHYISVEIESQDLSPEAHITINDSLITMSCKAKHPNFTVRWCRVIAPHGDRIMLEPGVFSEKYSFANTNFSAKTCQLEISTRGNVEAEYGRWRIDVGQTNNDFTGCYFTVPDNNKFQHSMKLPEREKSVNSLLGDSITFDCSVPWSIKYCYLIHPNGENIQSTSVANKRKQDVGVCQIEIKNLTRNDEGVWICGVSSQESSEDVLFHTTVSIANRSLLLEQYSERTSNGLVHFLLCKSPTKHPLEYCRFVAPKNKAYNLQPQTNSLSRFEYWGKGLQYGECGIKIATITSDDVGTWTCAVSYRSMLSNEEYGTFQMQRSEPATAFAIGLSIVGLVIVAGLAVFISLRCKKRRSEADFTRDVRNPSMSSEENFTNERHYAMYTVNPPAERERNTT